MFLDTQIKFLKGVGDKRAEQFSKLGVTTIGALLHYFPRTYIDWSSPVPIAGTELNPEKVCIRATITTAMKRYKSKSGKIIYETDACDDTATVHIVIFNNKYAAEKLVYGQEVLLRGPVELSNGKRVMKSPDIAVPTSDLKIQPVYKTTGTMSSNYIATSVKNALSQFGAGLEEALPGSVLEQYDLMPLEKAIREIHFPTSMEAMYKARDRFIFEELYELQLGILTNKKNNKAETSVVIRNDFTEEFVSTLSFTPTGAQRKCIDSAMNDMKSGFLMNRLLQGDVGSGKTMVAAALMYSCAKNGYQSAMMAPTEILARQHLETLKKFFAGTDIVVEALTGSNTAKEKQEIYERLKNGDIDVIVGTHAIISTGVEFSKLGLVITDEQHRFGVRQRGKLQEKGNGAHVLIMSATPIPRTLALSLYGDLDVSVIDELPKGRIPIETYKITSDIRQRAFGYIKKFLDEGRQGYIVCPLVEEGDLDDLISATEYFERISKNEFKDYRVGLLHGQMKTAEKNEVMEKFVSGEIQLLVSTVVIEVGVDVPNAVIMLIENAERFGLSQLHQLRGRVGRGKYQSTCILLSDNGSEQTQERLKVMTSTNDGFEIAQCDLDLRGPGDFFGSRQHGLPPLYIATMLSNMATLNKAEEAARETLRLDPTLERHPLLLREVDALFSRIETAS